MFLKTENSTGSILLSKLDENKMLTILIFGYKNVISSFKYRKKRIENQIENRFFYKKHK
jgi:hypothetical protein